MLVATWNCAMLNEPSRQAALHNSATPLGKADIVFIQEMQLTSPQHLLTINPFLQLQHPFATQGHQAILGSDCGILLQNTKWVIEESFLHHHATYARIRIPDSEPALGQAICTLYLWSIHALPDDANHHTFWAQDQAGLSQLDIAAANDTSAAVIGTDWNAVAAPMLDNFPPRQQQCQLPLGQLAQAGMSVETHPSRSDHSVVILSLRTSMTRGELGPGTWHLHREAHLQPGFELRMSHFAEQLPKETPRPPIAAWYAFVERVCTTSSNVITTLSQQARKREAQRIATLQELANIDIRHGDQNRARFLELLAVMRQMEIGQATDTIKKHQATHELNMFQPTAWILPKLESCSFAALPSICNNQGIHHHIIEKLLAIQRFYTTLFTPKDRDRLSEEASSMLLSSVKHHISLATRHTCDTSFTMDELHSILSRSQEMSAPGLDGITYPLLCILGNTAFSRLCALGNALFHDHHLPDGKPMLWGVLLPKKGDLSLLSNYRPLSIAASSFRLLGVVISNRLQVATQEVISPSQTGFILGL
ncbi:hypothetical protein NDA14_007558 [Ustilago hordei]|nr:hypothetical protein NDA14_007558 [Ustilago hordei]